VEVSGENLSKVRLAIEGRYKRLTPGSVTEAWMKEEIQIKNMYANRMGIAGETLNQSHGALFKTVSG
jgi:hypothetical protein